MQKFQHWLSFLAVSISFNSWSSPPDFFPPELFRKLPKPAAIISHDVNKLLLQNEKNIVGFDVHGIFSMEKTPSDTGMLTLSNRFIPLLSHAAQKAKVFALSAHDKPELLLKELSSLQYGPEQTQSVLAQFAGKSEKQAPINGIVLFPFVDGSFRIIKFSRFSNIVSASLPGTTFYREKAIALLLGQLDDKVVSSLVVPAERYQHVFAEVNNGAKEIAEVIASQPGKFFPFGCVSWNLIPEIKSFAETNWHHENSSEEFLENLNRHIETEVCGQIKKGKREYPHGKPTTEQKAALKEGLADQVEKFLAKRISIVKSVDENAIKLAITRLLEVSHGHQVVFVDDSYDNLISFKRTILKSGYFLDSKIYLEYAQDPKKDKELDEGELRKAVNPLSKSMEDLKESN